MKFRFFSLIVFLTAVCCVLPVQAEDGDRTPRPKLFEQKDDKNLDRTLIYKSPYQCPSAHSEYKQVLAQLKDLKSKLSKLECQEMSIQLGEITDLVSKQRQEFVKIISKNKNKKLSAEDAKKVQEYTSKVTEKVNQLIGMTTMSANGGSGFRFWKTNRCELTPEDKYALISRTSSLVYEATDLISTVAGPYAVPISVGGNLLAGVIKGVGSFMKSMDAIDFQNEDKRLFYAETLCLYHQYDNEVRTIMNPNGHISALTHRHQHIQNEIEKMASECGECYDIAEEFLNKGMPAEFFKNQDEALRNLDKLNSEARIGKALKDLLLKYSWSSDQLDRFQSIIHHPTEGLEPGEVQSLQNRIRGLLVETASPEFLKWYMSTSLPRVNKRLKSAIKDVNPKFHREKGQVLNMDAFKKHLVPNHVRQIQHIANNQNFLNKDSTFYYHIMKAYNHWKELEKRVRSYKEYCSFFRDSHQYPGLVRQYCQAATNKKFMNYERIVAQVAIALARIINRNDFPEKKLGPFELAPQYYLDLLKQETPREIAALTIAEKARIMYEKCRFMGSDNDAKLTCVDNNNGAPIRGYEGRIRLQENNGRSSLTPVFDGGDSMMTWEDQMEMEINSESRRESPFATKDRDPFQ